MQTYSRDLTQFKGQWHLINTYECIICSDSKAEVGLGKEAVGTENAPVIYLNKIAF